MHVYAYKDIYEKANKHRKKFGMTWEHIITAAMLSYREPIPVKASAVNGAISVTQKTKEEIDSLAIQNGMTRIAFVSMILDGYITSKERRK